MTDMQSKVFFYTNTLCTIRLPVILEYVVSKTSLSVSQLDRGLLWGIRCQEA